MMTTKASRYKGKGIILHTSFPFVDQIQAALSIWTTVGGGGGGGGGGVIYYRDFSRSRSLSNFECGRCLYLV